MDAISLFGTNDISIPSFEYMSFKHILIDRKSKYTVTGGSIGSKEQIKGFIKNLNKDKQFKKATHNTYAYRVQLEDGAIIEGKNDDGETGAGNCVLRELKRENIANIIVVVSRYYGGIHLHADRFKNVMEATKIFLRKSGLKK